MKRKANIYPGQIEAFLKENNKAVPIWKIAKEFGCTPDTIKKKLRILRHEGKPILPTPEGILFADKIQDIERAKLIKDTGTWLGTMLIILAEIGDLAQKPLLQARKLLESKEDRKKIREILLMLTRMIDIIDIDHQLEE